MDMNCPHCGRTMPVGSRWCAHCGTPLQTDVGRQPSGKMTCTVCGKLMPLRGVLEHKQMCAECEQKHLQHAQYMKNLEERRKCDHVNRIASEHPELRAKITNRLGAPVLGGAFFVEDSAYYDICNWGRAIDQAHNYELAKRHEDAARLYESLGLWKEAGEARDRKTSRTVKHVTVNLNDLINSLRSGGLTVPYKCTGCGATITVDSGSSVDSLKFCSYCGSAVNISALTKLLEEALK